MKETLYSSTLKWYNNGITCIHQTCVKLFLIWLDYVCKNKSRIKSIWCIWNLGSSWKFFIKICLVCFLAICSYLIFYLYLHCSKWLYHNAIVCRSMTSHWQTHFKIQKPKKVENYSGIHIDEYRNSAGDIRHQSNGLI